MAAGVRPRPRRPAAGPSGPARLRGRRPGGTDRGQPAVDPRRPAGRPAGVVDPGGPPSADRPAAIGRRPDSARGRRRDGPAARRPGPGGSQDRFGLRRLAAVDDDVRPSRAAPPLPGRDHLALRGRSDDGGDRRGVPGSGGDDGAAPQPGAGDVEERGVLLARPRRAARADRVRPRRLPPDLQRGPHSHQRPGPAGRRAHRRGDPADPDGARHPAGARRGHRPARAHAADPGALARARRPPR